MIPARLQKGQDKRLANSVTFRITPLTVVQARNRGFTLPQELNMTLDTLSPQYAGNNHVTHLVQEVCSMCSVLKKKIYLYQVLAYCHPSCFEMTIITFHPFLLILVFENSSIIAIFHFKHVLKTEFCLHK